MSSDGGASFSHEAPTLVDTKAGVSALAARLAQAERVALDVEGNGLFAYRSRLCAAQVAWSEGDGTCIAIVDTLAADIAPLEAVLGPSGPLKILHDLSFDARMLADAGVRLGRAHDTSVFARFLGHEATGLARVLSGELGVSLDKGLQRHDWSRRPLAAEEVAYLAGDVAHLLELHAVLVEKALSIDVFEEIEEECAHRVRASVEPSRDPRPPYVRMKHAGVLGPIERSVLRNLFELRESVARARDLPPHQVLPNERLLGLARAHRTLLGERPGDFRALDRIAGAGLVDRHLWLECVERGVASGDVPEEERHHFERPVLDVPRLNRRRQLEGALTGWRRREAERRSVCDQVVLPGHCLAAVVDTLLDPPPDALARAATIRAIPGIGARRAAAYCDEWLALLELEERTG